MGYLDRTPAMLDSPRDRFRGDPHLTGKIVALSEIYGTEATARALDDAFDYGAFSSDYITNLLEVRARTPPEPSALHLTRRSDLLELELPQPNLSLYDLPADPRDDTP